MEIERKWLIDVNRIPYDLSKYESWEIEQAYISFNPTIRIRKISNLNSFVLTMKSPSKDKGLSREEYEMSITNDQYINLLNKIEGIVLKKTRYRIPYENKLIELDLFHDCYEGLGYIEIEFKTKEEAKAFIKPEWVLKELTSDSRYSNAALANKINLVYEEKTIWKKD